MSEVETTTTESTEHTESAEQPESLSLLAKRMFGPSYTGEEKTPVEQPTVEQPAEEVVEEAEPENTEEPEGEVISSIDELADYLKSEHGLEVDGEWFDGLKIPGKVNGEEVSYTLKELRDSVQKVQAADDYLTSAKAKVKQQAEEHENTIKQMAGNLAVTSKLVEAAEALLSNDNAKVNWQELRQENPAEYSALRAEFEDRRQAINKIRTDALTEYQQWQEQEKERATGVRAEQLHNENQMLMEKIPEWRDAEKAGPEKANMVKYLVSQGFSEEDISGAADHRLIVLARKAMLYDQMQTKTDASRKKISKIPKVLKPGTPKSSDQRGKEEIDKLVTQAAKSGTIDDAFKLLQAKRRAGK